MMPNRSRPARPLPVYRLSPVVYFNLDMTGAFRMVRGPGLERTGRTESEWAGVTVCELYDENPTLVPVYTALLSGQAVQTVVEYGGEPWFMDAAPTFEGSVQIGATGLVHPLEEDQRPPEEPEPDVYEAAGDNERHAVWSADSFVHFLGDEFVLQTRVRSLQEFRTYQSEESTRLHHVRVSSPARPHLRLLPP